MMTLRRAPRIGSMRFVRPPIDGPRTDIALFHPAAALPIRAVVPISRRVKFLVVLAFLALGAFVPEPAYAQLVGPAVVQSDASLVVNGKRLVLADIELIPAGRTCDTNILPPLCGAPAAIALRTKITHFVSCRLRADVPGLDTAVCQHAAQYPAGGEDLGAFLVAQGWATASPTAPPFYRTMETIARSQGRGAWGLRIDRLINPQLQ